MEKPSLYSNLYMQDKYTAVWVSHSSMSDFLECPRAYYLKNVYRDTATNKKINIMSPALALGQSVHEVLESLSVLPKQSRFNTPLIERFHEAWKKLSGKRGGFFSDSTEFKFKSRGEDMIRRVSREPGPLAKPAVKIQKDLPFYWLSEEDNIILCGKIDWLEYMPDDDTVHIIDFKTGKSVEDVQSLQLPIYHLLVHNCQNRRVTKASYWYLEQDSGMVEKELPPLEDAHKKVLTIAQKMKLARQLDHFSCPQGDGGCHACKPFELILQGQGELVGVDNFGNNVYVFDRTSRDDERNSMIL
ncbi:MAG: hypothetical protein UY77_C0021G0009 [Candidatus Uhrbacteria bacterium GW2011_GWA2_53_10]|uniref:PD-(D/E)XK endonuclease-like domain-containing protein n=1 Tax=Candidatus Uhrbacteria bacterium GW2011_GWA2_53_10 TaxID=1618980 RepID=A0A0G1XNS8_9BACT|nr:MAG: hypothetical protein UY77_C0021G0009 [Candidatus Uhrbacteria bacterium GW2011_GWA2_53_10]HBF66872.1 hypothetical protein [Candidatus Magasanikbacteria bacterium]